MDAPLLDQNPCLIQAVEQFAVQELITEFAVVTCVKKLIQFEWE